MGGFDDGDWIIKVNSQPDAPKEFSLIEPPVGHPVWSWPPSFVFKWEQAVDPEGGNVNYEWALSKNSDLNNRADYLVPAISTTDSFLVFEPKHLYVDAGTYYWRVVAISSVSSAFTICKQVGEISVVNGAWVDIADNTTVEIPENFSLLQNYPNPFSASSGRTQITYYIKENTDVKIVIYNALGQQVRELVTHRLHPGIHSIEWDGNDDLGRSVAGGIYICRMHTNTKVLTRKILIVP
jgi:hypothetical protein